jgi:ubiquinone biosynthesis O-methyltransferase
MARLGAEVVGADAAARNIPVARLHAEQSGLAIDYRHTTAEALAAAGETFDVVLNMEVVEHVADPLAYLTACQRLLRPGGLMICSTINRNAKSFAMAIVGAEYVMRWLPKGTHDWAKFITPDELFDLLRRAGLEPVDRKGFVFNPVTWSWGISHRDLSVNYVTASVKPSRLTERAPGRAAPCAGNSRPSGPASRRSGRGPRRVPQALGGGSRVRRRANRTGRGRATGSGPARAPPRRGRDRRR